MCSATWYGPEEVDEARVVLELSKRWAFFFEEAGTVMTGFVGEGVDQGGSNVERVGLEENPGTWSVFIGLDRTTREVIGCWEVS